MDYFCRQRAVPDWQQALIEQQRALLLGVGGIGCTIAKELWYVIRFNISPAYSKVHGWGTLFD